MRSAAHLGRSVPIMTKVSRLNRHTVDAAASARRFDARELDRLAAASARRLPHAGRRRRGALRRQGARSEEARLVVLPEEPGSSRASRDDRAGARVETTVDALRGRGAAARKQPDQGARAALQHPVPRRQVLSVPACHRRIAFPRLRLSPRRARRRHRYFGPFPNAGAVRESIQLLQKVFRLRTCEDTVFANRSRPCLLHQIQRCTAPCVGLIAEADYADDVHSAEAVPRGQDDEVMEQLKRDGAAAAAALEYERGALPRPDRARCAARSRGSSSKARRPATSTSIAAAIEDGPDRASTW